MWDFYYGQHTISLASHIALVDADVPLRLHRLDLKAGQHQSGDYAALNPKLRVPCLVTEEGSLTETPAILTYIAQKVPEAKLAPLDPFEFAKVQEFMSYIASTLHVAHAHRMRGHRWVDPANVAAIEAMQAKVPHSVGDAFEYVQDTYDLDPFVFGDTYTIADPYLFTVSQWIKSDGVAEGRVPRVQAHSDRMKDRASVQEALRQQFA